MQDVLSLYRYQIEGSVPTRLILEVLLKKDKVKSCLKEGWTFEESGFPWQREYSFFIAEPSEVGEKTTYIITGERVKFKYRIYDDVLLPHFINYNKRDRTIVKAWTSEDGIVHILRNEYDKNAEIIWKKKFGDFEGPFYIADYEKDIARLKKIGKGYEIFKSLFFEKETSNLNIPEESHHIRFIGFCEIDEEILARLNRLWFNPTYTFILEIVKSSSPIPDNMDMKWILEKNPPHKTASRFILYSIKRFFQPTSLTALSKIPLEDYASFAEKTYFSLLSLPSFCDRSE